MAEQLLAEMLGLALQVQAVAAGLMQIERLADSILAELLPESAA